MKMNILLLLLAVAVTFSSGEEQCSSENEACSCPGGEVKYGSGNTWSDWITVDATGTINCTNAVFGDPSPGQEKVCMCRVICIAFSEEACAAAATSAGKEMGYSSEDLDFVGDYTTKGCYGYETGTYSGSFFYGEVADLSDADSLISPSSNKYRPAGWDCDYCLPYSEDTCAAAAEIQGKELGYSSEDLAFAGDYNTKGCYGYKTGKYAGSFFYGEVNDLSDADSSIDTSSNKYRPYGWDVCPITQTDVSVQNATWCADEDEVCSCTGYVRYGNPEIDSWSYWVYVNGSISCSNSGFGGDPAYDNLKECWCVETCNDGIQNQGENGVDCGGPCASCPVAAWVEGQWGTCSTTCGDGTQSRTVTCELDGSAVPTAGKGDPVELDCTEAEPSATQSCNLEDCDEKVGGDDCKDLDEDACVKNAESCRVKTRNGAFRMCKPKRCKKIEAKTDCEAAVHCQIQLGRKGNYKRCVPDY